MQGFILAKRKKENWGVLHTIMLLLSLLTNATTHDFILYNHHMENRIAIAVLFVRTRTSSQQVAHHIFKA